MAEVQKTADQAEQASVKNMPEAAAVSGVISGQPNQEIHGQASSIAHANDKTLSEPDMIAMGENETPAEYEARVAQIQANRFGFFDSAESMNAGNNQLIAQALPGNAEGATNPSQGLGDDGRWHFQNPRLKPGQDIAGELKEWLWNDMPNLPRETVNGTWALTEPLLKGLNAWMQRKPDLTYMEYLTGIEKDRGRSPWTDVSFEGTDKAYAAFPELAKHEIPKEMISGIILNEVLHAGDPLDPAEDLSVRMFGTVRDWNGLEKQTVSVGPAQMQIRNIRHLVEKYPELSNFKDDPIRAAINPETAPMFVAAYLCDKIELLENYNRQHSAQKPVPVESATLAYLYNPDVISKDEHYRRIDEADKLANKMHLDTRAGWKTENYANNDEIVLHSKTIQDILSATRACYR